VNTFSFFMSSTTPPSLGFVRSLLDSPTPPPSGRPHLTAPLVNDSLLEVSESVTLLLRNS